MNLDRITPNIYRWSEPHGKGTLRYDWHSYFLRIAPAQIVVVDPLPATEGVLREIELIGVPRHIVLTCNWHTRAAQQFRELWGCRVLLNERGLIQKEIEVDETFHAGDRLWDSLGLISMAALSWPEEVAIVFENVLLVLDALVGARPDLAIEDGEIGIHPNRFSMGHIGDDLAAKTAILNLANTRMNEIHFGHGSPVLTRPDLALKRLAENPRYWGRDAVTPEPRRQMGPGSG